MESLTNTHSQKLPALRLPSLAGLTPSEGQEAQLEPSSVCQGVTFPCFSCHLSGCDVFLRCSLMSCLGMLGLSSCKGLLPESLESLYSRDKSCRLQH